MSAMFSVKNGAIFVGDAHANANKNSLFDWLCELEKSPPPQLFLMGDLFDFLTCTAYSQRFFSEVIAKINSLCERCEVFYFEGNHDFNLTRIFPKAHVFDVASQPQIFAVFTETTANQNLTLHKKVALSHGDIYLSFLETAFMRALRFKPLLWFLNLLDSLIGWRISKGILKSQADKKLDFVIADFEYIARARSKRYKEVSFVVEGHFHQGVKGKFDGQNALLTYHNLAAFANGGKFYEALTSDGELVLNERTFLKKG